MSATFKLLCNHRPDPGAHSNGSNRAKNNANLHTHLNRSKFIRKYECATNCKQFSAAAAEQKGYAHFTQSPIEIIICYFPTRPLSRHQQEYLNMKHYQKITVTFRYNEILYISPQKISLHFGLENGERSHTPGLVTIPMSHRLCYIQHYIA